jgi:N utilization substance protein B
MGIRRRARELALTVLYESEFQNIPYDRIVFRIAGEETLHDEVVAFLNSLLKTYFDNKTLINEEIEKHSSNWKISRMAYVDRNILRLGIAELIFISDIPKSVSINEYLEIAKKYGTEDSSSFINGILDKIEKRA